MTQPSHASQVSRTSQPIHRTIRNKKMAIVLTTKFGVVIRLLCLKSVCPWDHGLASVSLCILEWVASPFSRGSSQPRDQTLVSYISYIVRQVLYHLSHQGSLLCKQVLKKWQIPSP